MEVVQNRQNEISRKWGLFIISKMRLVVNAVQNVKILTEDILKGENMHYLCGESVIEGRYIQNSVHEQITGQKRVPFL